MCEGYWDRKLQRWVSLEELEEEELATLTDVKVMLPAPPVDPKRKSVAMLR